MIFVHNKSETSIQDKAVMNSQFLCSIKIYEIQFFNYVCFQEIMKLNRISSNKSSVHIYIEFFFY